LSLETEESILGFLEFHFLLGQLNFFGISGFLKVSLLPLQSSEIILLFGKLGL